MGLDECWLDITSSKKLLHKTALQIANEIRERIKHEFGFTVSVGVSFSKVFAKLGSDLKKPDDIADLDSHNGKHSDGTNKNDMGGPKGGSGGASGSGGDGKGKGKGSNKEFDPFKASLEQGAQGQQITPEQELEAIIKRLAGLTGEAKKGADRGLQDFFNQITGGGSL
jgi:hypothetical protein